jgi:WD40 repeat protein
LPNNHLVGALAFDPTGTRLATAVGVLDVRTETIVSEVRSGGETLAWSPAGNLFAGTCTSSPSVWVSDSATGNPVRTVKLERKAVQDFAFSADGKWLAVVSNEEMVRVWNTQTWEERHALAWGIGKLKCIAFSPDGMRAACGSNSGTILIWDWE